MNIEKDYTERTEFNADQLHELIAELAAKRPLFHSEADFQFALAWLIQQEYKTAKVRLEYPVYIKPLGKNKEQDKKPNSFLDLLVIYKDEYFPIELKYKTKSLITEETAAHEAYHLAEDNAGNTGRYDFIKDIYRIEQIKHSFIQSGKNCHSGFTIWLTSDSSLYQKHNPEEPKFIYYNFSTGDFREIKKGIALKWQEKENNMFVECKNPEKYKPRDNDITLNNSYTIRWAEYSSVNGTNLNKTSVKRNFKYSLLEI